MTETKIEAFNAVVSFVNDLWEVYGNPKKVSPLALYRRLISHIKPTQKEGIHKTLSGFVEFFKIRWRVNIVIKLLL